MEPKHAPHRPHYEAIAKRIEQAHVQIVSLLDRASESFPALAETRLLIEGLPPLLQKHFDDEERENGLFEVLRARQPSVGPDLKALEQEHREILRTVEELEQGVEALDQVEDRAQREEQIGLIQQETIRLLRMIRRHERVEADLTVEILYREEGGSG